MPSKKERRKHLRMPRLKAGRIIFNDKCSVMNCQLRDLSESGARLAFANTLGAPDEFIVDLPGITPGRWAKRAWVKLNEMGVAFL